jgi:hypothetical protein
MYKLEKCYARESRFWFGVSWYEYKVNVIAARESGGQDRRASPVGQRDVCKNGALFLGLTKVTKVRLRESAPFLHTSL